jgi:hypothetical protein
MSRMGVHSVGWWSGESGEVVGGGVMVSCCMAQRKGLKTDGVRLLRSKSKHPSNRRAAAAMIGTNSRTGPYPNKPNNQSMMAKISKQEQA